VLVSITVAVKLTNEPYVTFLLVIVILVEFLVFEALNEFDFCESFAFND
jgi:hypothetical protein